MTLAAAAGAPAPALALAPAPAPARPRIGLRRQAMAWALAAPFLIGLTLFVLLPCLGVLVMAFTDWQLGARDIAFAGLDNFTELFGDRVFAISAANTLLYALMVTPASVVLGLLLAIAVERSAFGRAFFRSAFFLPVVSTTVAMAIVWEFLLHPT